MPWIADVVPDTKIASVWGNAIRDHVVHVFANKAERDAQAVPREGMRAYCIDTRITYVRVGSAWWVEAMPWRNAGTILGFAAPLNSVWAIMPPSAGGFQWRQAMGAAQMVGSATYQVPQTGVSYWIAFQLPVPAAFGAPMGTARVYMASKGTIAGGMASWMDNGGPGGASRAAVGTLGQDLAAMAAVNLPSGQGPNINIDVAVAFSCDPSVDTP